MKAPRRACLVSRFELGVVGPLPEHPMMTRNAALEAGADEFDVAIVGGGVSGAAVYRELCARGYRVLLVDRGDFASGTSQSSGMLVWGGLLYLRNLDLATVWKLCKARDRWLAEDPGKVETLRFRYMPLRKGGRNRRLVQAALYSYWLLGRRRRRRPATERDFDAKSLLELGRFGTSLVYEEACLPDSDSRCVLSWITGYSGPGHVALNHCELRAARFESDGRGWHLELHDRLGNRRSVARARMLVNAAGVWAERVSEFCGLRLRYRHVLSKGVYLAFRRPEELREGLAFEMQQYGDSQTFTPWGPVALWGPTESLAREIQSGFTPEVSDIRFLLSQANANLRAKRGVEDIVSLRCGIRPLAVERAFTRKVYPLDLSRRHFVARDPLLPAVTIFGGKFTSAQAVARECLRRVREHIEPRGVAESPTFKAPALTLRFPGLDAALPDPDWCVEHESCATLDDYLRRRTNIAQWVACLGLGETQQHLPEISAIAERVCAPGTAAVAMAALQREAQTQARLLAQV